MVGDYPKRRSDLSLRDIEGDTVVLDRVAKQVHRLNPTASFIWHRCDGHRTVGAIADELVGSFDVDPVTAKEAVIAALHQFDGLGLLDHARD